MKQSFFLNCILFVGVSVGFLGCSAPIPPKRYEVKVNTYPLLTLNEKKIMLTRTLESEHRLKFFDKYNKTSKFTPTQDGGNITLVGTNATFAHRFAIDSSENLFRKDISRELHGPGVGETAYCGLCDDYGFSSFISLFQEDLKVEYDQRLKAYSNFKQIFENKKKLFYDTKIVVRDNLNVLSDKGINLLNSKIAESKTFIPLTVDRFLGQSESDILNNSFAIESGKINYIGRYEVVLENYIPNKDYFFSPAVKQVNINEIKFNYIPDSYSNSDKNIEISVSHDVMTIKNKTDKVIKLDTITVYYNKKNFTEQLKSEYDQVVLAPKSSKEYYVNHVPSKYVVLKSKNQKVNYGYAVSYYINNNTKLYTLFDSKEFSVNSFE